MADSTSVDAPHGDPSSNALSNVPGDQPGDPPGDPPDDPPAQSDDSGSESSSPSTDCQPVTEISKDNGDVILILPRARLRVSSVILSSASPVFTALFGPNFSEGQAMRSPQNPKEISLPDDDTEAMDRLCRMVHNQGDPLESELEESPAARISYLLLQLVTLADKYCCMHAIRTSAKFQLSCLAAPSVAMSLGQDATLELIAVSYLLSSSRYFTHFTRFLVLDSTCRFDYLAKQPAMGILPISILFIIDEQRVKAWNVIHLQLPRLAEQQCYQNGCAAISNDLKFPETLLRMPWPSNADTSIRDIIRTARNVDGVPINLRLGCKHARDWTHMVTRVQIETVLKTADQTACGLCLDCFKNGVKVCKHAETLLQWVKDERLT